MQPTHQTMGDGSRAAPLQLRRPEHVTAGDSRTAKPTPGQAKAGNYAKRHLRWHGFEISVETEAGKERRGTGKDGRAWSVRMPVPYGYFKGTRGADKDQADVYIGPRPASPKVFVVDQVDPDTRRFDESKILIGFSKQSDARAAYRRSFSDGRGADRIGAMTEMRVGNFKRWLRADGARKPIAHRDPVLSAARRPRPAAGYADGGIVTPTLEDRLRRAREDLARRQGSAAGEMQPAKPSLSERLAKARTALAPAPQLSPTSRTARLKVYSDDMDELDAMRQSAEMTEAIAAREPPVTSRGPQRQAGMFMAVDKPKGLLVPGNIDLVKRPKVKNADGSISTVRSMSFDIDGNEVLIPTVSDDGRIMSEQEALDTYRRTKRHLGIFESPESATAYAEGLHRQQDALYNAPRVEPFPSPMNLPPPESALEARRQASGAAKRLPSSHGRPVPQPTLGERLRHNIADAIDNTLRGAMMLVPPEKPDLGVYERGFEAAAPIKGTPLDLSDSPLAEAVREQAAKDYALTLAEQQRRAKAYKQRQQFPLPAPEGALQTGAAVAGQLAGSATSPESLVPVGRGANLLNTFLNGAKAAGLANLATDPLVQKAQIDAGLRERFDLFQPFLSAAGGAFLGGTFNVTPEIAGRIARAAGAQIGKAADKVTNSDVWQAMRSWLQNSDQMPDELKVEPTFERSRAAAEPAALGAEAEPPPRYREHVVTPPPTAPAREPVYQGAVRGEPFALPPHKPDMASAAPAARTGWPAEFPPIVVHRSATSPVRMTQHPDYAAAKAGDADAANRVVSSLVDPARIDSIKTAIGAEQPILVPVFAGEGDEARNMLAFAYAEELARRLGLAIDDEIVQVNRPKRRQTASAEERFGKRVQFDGEVRPGQTYVLVDDHATMGGTLADLRAHIEGKGGRVILATTLTASRGSERLAVKPEVLAALRRKHSQLEEAWRAAHGYGFEGLTNAEALSIFRLDDAARNRLVAAAQEGAGGEVPAGPPGSTATVASGQAADVARPAIPAGARLAPSPFRHGDAGTLGKAVPRTEAQLVSILDRADARRFAPRANALYRQAAEEQRQAFLGHLDEAAEAAASGDAVGIRRASTEASATSGYRGDPQQQYERGFIDGANIPVKARGNVRNNSYNSGLIDGAGWRKANPKPADEPPYREVLLTTLRGRRTTYRLPNDPEVIADFRSRFTRAKDVEKFFAKGPVTDVRVPVPKTTFTMLGVRPGNVFADYRALQVKHPEWFATPDDVRQHVEHVFAAPTHVLSATEPNNRLLVRINGPNRAAVVRIKLRGGKYSVRSAFVVSDEQLTRKINQDAGRRRGSTPDDPGSRSQGSATDTGHFTAPRDADQPAASTVSRDKPGGQRDVDKLYAQPGAAHVGPRVQTFDPAVPIVKDPLRRESILREFVKGMGMPLYTGRIKSKRQLGFFRPAVGEVRIKKPGDIETAAHEMAHLLDNYVPEIRKQWSPATNANAAVRKELAGVSYDASKLYEGFAEFVRLWMTQKNQAAAKAPQFHQWFESFVARSKYGPTLRKAQADMHAWFDQAALDRGRSKIGAGPEINEGLVRPFDRFRQTVTDDLHGIANMERSLTGTLSPMGAYETARLTRGAAAIIEGALTMGAPKVNSDGSHSFVGKGLQQILDPVADRLDDYLMYAVGRSASELMTQGRERLFTAAEVKGMLALEAPEFRTAFNEYQAWNKAILDFAEDKGIIDPIFRKTWRRTQYMPFHRVGQGGAFSPVPGDWRGIKALTGGSENLRPILGNMIQNAAMLIQAALTNEARLKAANLASRRGGARFMVKIPKEERAVRVHRDEIERAILEALGVKNAKQLPPDVQQVVDQIVDGMAPMTSLLLRGQTPTGKGIVATLFDGKPTYWEVADPLLFRAMTALQRKPAHWIVRALAIPKRIGQATVTLTPDFMAANILRDTLSGFLMSRHGFRPLVDSAIGFKSRLLADQSYREFIANGGGLSSYLLDETAYRRHLERFYTKKGINYQTVLDAPSKLLQGLERIAESFEQATRLGEYRRAGAAGAHPRHAAYSAREVSTDFAMRGDAADPGRILGPVGQTLGFLYDTAIFLKASVNGLDRFYRGLAEDPNRGTIAAKAGLIALLSMGNYALNRGNPLYEQLEDWDRDTHWHFFPPTTETLQAQRDGRELPPIEDRFHHLRMPKIWEVGAIASIAERQLQGVLDGQPLEAQQRSLRVIGDLMNFEYLPQALAPLVEVGANYDRFTGRPIEGQADRELLPFARADARTPTVLRKLGEEGIRHLPRDVQEHGLAVGALSPKNIEHLVRGYFNTWGLYGFTVADAAFFDDRPDLRVDQLPVVRRFYREEPATQTKWVTELYDAIEVATQARRTMRDMEKRYRPDIADELADTAENRAYRQMNFADERMRAFRKEMLVIADAPDLEAVQQMAMTRARRTKNIGLVGRAKVSGVWRDLGALKRVLIDDVIRERNAFAEAVIKDVEQRRQGLRATGTP